MQQAAKQTDNTSERGTKEVIRSVVEMAVCKSRESGRSGEEEELIEMSPFHVVKENTASQSNESPPRSHKMNPQRQKNTNRPLWPQLTIMTSAYICNIAAGMSFGHSAVLLPELQRANSSVTIDENISSWIASSYTIAGPVGTLFAGIFMEVYGRRWNNITANAAMLAGWLLIAAAQDKFMILFGRIAEGFSRCMLHTGVAVMVDELSDPEFRGFIMGCCGTFTAVGILIISSLGASVDWRTASWIATAVSFASLVAFWQVAESPTWLVRRNRMQEAIRSLRWVWGPEHTAKATEELAVLQTRYEPEKDTEHTLHGHTGLIARINHFLRISRSVFTPAIFKPFVIILVFNIFQPICGHSMFMFYAVDILHRMKRNSVAIMDENIETVCLSVVRLFSVTFSSFCMFRLGRRQIGLVSGIGASVSGICLAVILYLNTLETGSPVPPQTEGWLVLVLTVLFIGSHSFGFYMLPAMMIAETQAAHVRSVFCGCIFTINDIIFGVVVKSYPSMTTSVDIHGMFLIFGISCLLCTIFIYIFLPETQGKSLMEIEDYFKQKNIMWISRKKYRIHDEIIQ